MGVGLGTPLGAWHWVGLGGLSVTLESSGRGTLGPLCEFWGVGGDGAGGRLSDPSELEMV